MAIDVRPKRFTVAEFERMGELGILSEQPRLELIDGEIMQMNPIGWGHAFVVNQLSSLLIQQIGNTAALSVQNPLVLGEFSEPQPDLILLRGQLTTYAKRHPTPADTLVVVEVADSTLTYDTRRKLPLYAWSGVPEVWVFDLTQRVLQAHAEPQAGGYRSVSVHRAGDVVSPRLCPQLAVSLTEVFTPLG